MTEDSPLSAATFEALLDPHIAEALKALDGPGPLLAGMARYHLGLVDADFAKVPPMVTRAGQGKRMRPKLAMLCAAAAGGDPKWAAPVAAAIELLHNFTLVHDDIQDASPFRRHRATVWSIWGVSQAINAGDALFAAAHLALYRVANTGLDASTTLRLAVEYDRMTIEIVRGQVMDLEFEGRDDVTPEHHLDMITNKTAVIVRYATWAGALIGGADNNTAERFGQCGLTLGVGFQIQDDYLGIWGTPETTGKVAADDIRRRKQSLPIVMLRTLANAPDRAELHAVMRGDSVDEAGVSQVLGLLDRYSVRERIAERVREYHERARSELLAAAGPGPNAARDELLNTLDQLGVRDH